MTDDTDEGKDKQTGKHRSQTLTGTPGGDDWAKRAGARAMLRAVDFDDEDFTKPLVTVGCPQTNITPCNAHIDELGDIMMDEAEELDMKPFSFGTPVVTDGETMGMEGMKYSLPSRDLIADCIEMMHEAYTADGLLTLSGCDKTIPGALMPLARNNSIGLTLYGGTIRAGHLEGEDLTIISAFEAVGAYSKGEIDADQLHDIECHSCPGPGACGGMFTANTMASCIEAMGMSIPGSASHTAVDEHDNVSEEKRQDCIDSVHALRHLLDEGIHARDIMTKKAFENAITVMMALGGSTNAVLHLLALANEAKVDLSLDDFNRIAEEVPLIGNFSPFGKYVMADLDVLGGIPMVMKMLLEEGLLHGDCLTVTGQTVAENVKDAPDRPEDQDVIYPLDDPLAPPHNHVTVLKGNLAPGGAVMKLGALDLDRMERTARVYDNEEEALDDIMSGEITSDHAIIIQYEGPAGGPGMREMLSVSGALVGADLAEEVPLITDGRFSGGSHGIIIGHVAPEAFKGGPIAHVRDGDRILLDPDASTLDVDLSDEELEQRSEEWEQPEPNYERGVLAKYADTVSSASDGAITS